MSIPVALFHRTQYRYDRAVALGPQVIQLRPAPHCRTTILSYSLEVTPVAHILNWQFDPFANQIARVVFPQKTDVFAVEVKLVADLTPFNPFAFLLDPGYEQYPFAYTPELLRDLEPYRKTEPMGPLLRAFVGSVSRETQNTLGFISGVNQRVCREIGYVTRLEHGVQTCEQTLGGKTGSCRDTAWLLVQIFRQTGIAARFVSGYLIQLAGEDGVPAKDSADLHAWAEVYLPGAGWLGMDPTSGLFAAEGHIPLVCTPDAGQAAPIGGTVEPAGVTFEFAMTVSRDQGSGIRDQQAGNREQGSGIRKSDAAVVVDLKVPFSEEEWERVREVALGVDRELREQDVRLTMGGEPTYVGIDEPESLQWNLDALGDLKRTRGLALIRRLRERTAPGGLLHLGQGKWYPGEALPRWAFHCLSRNDGVAVWEDLDLIALEGTEYGFDAGTALQFVEALAQRLQVSREDVLAGFDPGEEGQVPAGYVMPLRRRQPGGVLAWSSQLWFERQERLVLTFGDSPIGYRIAVESMPWVAPDEIAYGVDELPERPARRMDLFGVEAVKDSLPAEAQRTEEATVLIRPALCVQAREGRLHVFLPFIPVIADYLDLVAAVEDTCAYLKTPVWVEGYTPPFDPRIRAFSLTPDPGVLEVNLPPTSVWDELEGINRLLAEEAEQNRLIAGKFAYDGTHLATGGGSHIVIGGATVPDSPLLRRPDVLRSMVAFWQNHPSLSYLFSGMYVGPTSQYPRVDEARVDALYELEVSFSQLPEEGCPPHILDGLFRNLLVDVSGNTHRAEFCIDKMYPPEGQGIRAGLLELRAFEMAPHYRMGLVEMLLVRALVLKFWKEPFAGDLVRWGEALHDRFMLPHFVRRDFAEVLVVLRGAGFAFEDDWFRARVEFRFPKIGSMTAGGVELELRQALEPWNVLAEETNSGRTGRSVDSSLERMQVKVTGLAADARVVVTCNGRRVPLTATGEPGEAVAGIRYRARRLSAALHPTIPVHTPLVFEVIDLASEQAVGRCTYYAAPPDGTVHTTRPRDAVEAKARRMARFVVDEAGYAAKVPVAETNPVFPMTLDLRWPAPGSELVGLAT